MKHFITPVALAALILLSSSCKKKETKTDEPSTSESGNTTMTLVKLGESYIIGADAKAVVYGTKEAEVGYNELYVALYDSSDGSRLSRGHFDLEPMMDMGSMQHSCPVKNTEDTVTTEGYFKTEVMFTMSGSADQWSLNLTFHNHKNEKFGRGKMALAVKLATSVKFRSTLLAQENNAALYMALVNPTKAVVGINDFEVVVYKKINGMEYVPVDDYSIVIEPTMPSMGHGSPNNVNPVIISDGHYKGKVNFTMSGLWQIKLKISKGGVLLSEDQFFEITI